MWSQLPGSAQDIGIGVEGSVWVIGSNLVPGGYGIYKWNGGGWDPVDGGAVRIAVGPDGSPWVVNNADQIFQWTSGTWQLMPGFAKDIGIGAEGSVWAIGANLVPGGYGIYKWNGSGWDPVDGGAVRIAVDPDGSPWVVNDGGTIFERTAGTWRAMPGWARDIAIGGIAYTARLVWVIGTDPRPGGFGVYGLDWLDSGPVWSADPDVGGMEIAVSIDQGSNLPWIVDGDSNILRKVS